eukprot:SAG11_NODE_23776_length_383_cov_0.897887_2_plen_30_part_01
MIYDGSSLHFYADGVQASSLADSGALLVQG